MIEFEFEFELELELELELEIELDFELELALELEFDAVSRLVDTILRYIGTNSRWLDAVGTVSRVRKTLHHRRSGEAMS